MPSRPVVLATALSLTLVLGGCLATPANDAANDPEASPSAPAPPSRPGPSPTPAGQNRPPTADLSVANASGAAPLTVTFSINGSDPDGTGLVWELDVDGDNTTDRTDSFAVRTVTWVYGSPGNFSAVLVVSDGTARARDSVEIVVMEPAPPPIPEPIVFNGTITGVWLPQAEYVGTPNNHTFDLNVSVQNITATIVFGDGSVDLDFALFAPDGTEVDIAATINPVDGEGEAPIGTDDPDYTSMLGTWTVQVLAGLAFEGAYTVTVTFA